MRSEDKREGARTASGMLGGMLGGVLGTAALQGAMGLRARPPERMRMPPPRVDPGEYVVSGIEALRGRRFPLATRTVAKRAAQWMYGLGWAGALTTWAPRLRMNRLGNAVAAGAGLGTLTWAAGYLGSLPAVGLTRTVTRKRPSKVASSLLEHIVYGVFSALPLYVAERVFPKRERVLA